MYNFNPITVRIHNGDELPSTTYIISIFFFDSSIPNSAAIAEIRFMNEIFFPTTIPLLLYRSYITSLSHVLECLNRIEIFIFESSQSASQNFLNKLCVFFGRTMWKFYNLKFTNARNQLEVYADWTLNLLNVRVKRGINVIPFFML